MNDLQKQLKQLIKDWRAELKDYSATGKETKRAIQNGDWNECKHLESVHFCLQYCIEELEKALEK